MRLSEQDELFLRAALGDRTQALESWRQIEPLLELDTIKGVRERLLPLIYSNLSRHGMRSGEMPKLKGTYRHTWARNQLLLSQFEEAVITLKVRGLDLKAVRDLSLVAGYLDDRGTRWIRAFAVEVDRVVDAASVLTEINWCPFGTSSDEGASLESRNRISGETVHFHLAHLSSGELGPPPQTYSAKLHEEEVRIASPSEQVMQSCLEGVTGEGQGLLGPAVDFLVVCNAASESIEWNWAESQSAIAGCRPILHDLLEIASSIYGRSPADLR